MAKATPGELCDDLKATLDISLMTLSRRLFSLEAFGIVERRS
jgi:DNA-binding HxlR family transcriptional regulator